MGTKQPTLLIVDDERLNLNTLVELFQDDYTVLVAKDGLQALARAQGEQKPDLILLDILMPDMDGFETCQRFKNHERTASIPIIFITALHEEEDQIRGFELGVVDFITKPFIPSVVKARVQTHLTLNAIQTQLAAQNLALIEAANLKEDVERVMRHDLKGPLNGIIGLPQILLAEVPMADEHQEMLQMIEQSGYQMLRMINQSLDLYKMESGGYRYQPQSVDLTKIVRKIQVAFKRLIITNKLSFAFMINGCTDNGRLAFIVFGEELLCHSMLSNLIQNALEAAPIGSQVLVSLEDDHRPVQVKIHNEGLVPAEIQTTFFDKYTTVGKSDGTGLGTYSAKLMAKTMGGDINMETSKNQGTTLTIVLPRTSDLFG